MECVKMASSYVSNDCRLPGAISEELLCTKHSKRSAYKVWLLQLISVGSWGVELPGIFIEREALTTDQFHLSAVSRIESLFLTLGEDFERELQVRVSWRDCSYRFIYSSHTSPSTAVHAVHRDSSLSTATVSGLEFLGSIFGRRKRLYSSSHSPNLVRVVLSLLFIGYHQLFTTGVNAVKLKLVEVYLHYTIRLYTTVPS
jgi:hypothetical protein